MARPKKELNLKKLFEFLLGDVRYFAGGHSWNRKKFSYSKLAELTDSSKATIHRIMKRKMQLAKDPGSSKSFKTIEDKKKRK